jgi:hypothetical protein
MKGIISGGPSVKDGKDGTTPIKGVDYFDGEDGYTPVKGVDYFDGSTPVKGVDYNDGSNGVDAPTPAWYGKLAGTFADGDPNELLRLMFNNPVNATPTNITASLARISYFRLKQNLTVNKIRFLGVGATTNIYRIALYNADTLARLMSETAFTTVAQTWGSVGNALNITLTAGQLYFIAVSVNTTGTTAGLQCFSSSTGRIGVLPKNWAGNLDIDLATPIVDPVALAQFAVTSGALPDPVSTVLAQTAWTGGMPAFFLDNNNA